MHTPVLLNEVVEALRIDKNARYIDATLGEGGHSLEIVNRGGLVLGIDADIVQVQNLESRIKNLDLQEKIRVAQGNYADIEKIAHENDFYPVDGIIFDLGLSMRQIKDSGRGFSYQNPSEPLDMRLSKEAQSTAADLVNSLDNRQLNEIFVKFSEEINSGAIAEAIAHARRLKKIKTVGDLTKTIDEAIGGVDRQVYSRIFQALRIAVNNEFENMKKGLTGGYKLLKTGGRIAVITFHSLEDRLVKQFIKEQGLETLNKKVIAGNKDLSYERSAKLRIIIKNENIN